MLEYQAGRKTCCYRQVFLAGGLWSYDYVELKPKHSGFHSTALDLLLEYLEVRKVILTGVATNICVLFTANDAYMRDYELFVPKDCVAANSEELNQQALEQIELVLKADIREAGDGGVWEKG